MGGPNVTGFLQILEQRKEREGRISSAGKSADYFIKANPDALQELGHTPESFANLGNEDKAAAVSGYLQEQALREHQMRMKEQQDQMQAGETFRRALGAALGRGRDVQQGVRSMAPVLKALGIAGGDEMQDFEAPQPGGMDMLNMGLTSGVSPEKIATLADSMARIRASGEDLTPGFIEDDETGARFLGRGKTTLPSGVNPKKAQAAAMPAAQHDDEGNLIGWTTTDVKGHSTFRQFKGGSKLQPARDGDNNIIPDFYITPEGKIVDTRTAIEKLTGSQAEKGKAGGAEQLVTDKSGKKWKYTGASADPTKDRDPSHWQAQ